MKLVEASTVTISQDTGTTPTQIRYAETIADTDTTSILKSVTVQTSFPVGTHTINLGQIATGKLLLIKPASDLLVNINGADTDYTVKGGKMSKIWADITSLQIEVTGAAQIVSIFVGGI